MKSTTGCSTARTIRASAAQAARGQFLIDNSGGKFSPEFIVVGPLTLSKSMGYYGGKPQPGEGNDGDVGKMVIEACQDGKELHGIDFSQFDYNNDNKVDNVYLFYSGPNDTTIPTRGRMRRA